MKIPDAASSSSTCQTRQTEQTGPELLLLLLLQRKTLERRFEVTTESGSFTRASPDTENDGR